MENTVTVRARFKGCNIQDSKVVMQFTLDPEYKGALPSLAMMTGSALMMNLTSDQQILFVDRETGEELDGQEEAFTDEPKELPPSAYEVSDDETDEAIWGEDEWADDEDGLAA